MLDVVVIGGGPAGLSAAMVLARCRRSVLVVDAGTPRDARSHALHGYLSRDGIAPLDLLRLGREDVRDVQFVVAAAEGAKVGDAIDVELQKMDLSGGTCSARLARRALVRR